MTRLVFINSTLFIFSILTISIVIDMFRYRDVSLSIRSVIDIYRFRHLVYIIFRTTLNKLNRTIVMLRFSSHVCRKNQIPDIAKTGKNAFIYKVDH